MNQKSTTNGEPPNICVLDIGGEGRHLNAWNLNPSRTRTLGPAKGSLIPRHIQGRPEAIPLPDGSVHQIIMERAPLRRASAFEMARVIVPGGNIILRHHASSCRNPHEIAQQLIDADFMVQRIKIGRQELQQTQFCNVGNVGTTRKMQSTFTIDSSTLELLPLLVRNQ